MSQCVELHADQEVELAAELLYRFFAAGLSDPHRGGLIASLSHSDLELAAQASDYLRERFMHETLSLGFGELPLEDLRLQPVIEALRGGIDALKDEHIRVFGLISAQECPPYETEYLANEEAFFRAQHLADLAGFYGAFGLELSPARRDRADHIATQLEFAALLVGLQRAATDASRGEQAAIARDARQAFLRDHLCWWTPSFLLAVRHRAESGFYEQLSRALAAFLPWDRQRLQIAPPHMPLQARATALPAACESCAAQ